MRSRSASRNGGSSSTVTTSSKSPKKVRTEKRVFDTEGIEIHNKQLIVEATAKRVNHIAGASVEKYIQTSIFTASMSIMIFEIARTQIKENSSNACGYILAACCLLSLGMGFYSTIIFSFISIYSHSAAERGVALHRIDTFLDDTERYRVRAFHAFCGSLCAAGFSFCLLTTFGGVNYEVGLAFCVVFLLTVFKDSYSIISKAAVFFKN